MFIRTDRTNTSIQYRSPHQIESTRKPVQPRNTMDYIKRMKERDDFTSPNSFVCEQSRIDHSYDMKRPILGKENMSYDLLSQMSQLQQENRFLKEKLQSQEAQRIQQLEAQLQQLQMAKQQPIVINNNINQDERTKSVPMFQFTTQRPSMASVNEPALHNFYSHRAPDMDLFEQAPHETHEKSTDLVIHTEGNQLEQYSTAKHQTRESKDIRRTAPDVPISYQATERKSESNVISLKSLDARPPNNQPQESIQLQFEDVPIKPQEQRQQQQSVKMDIVFGEQPSKSLAQYAKERPKNIRKASTPIPEETEWIVDVKQRSKEEQIKLRKQMMEYGKRQRKQPSMDEKQISRAISPVMERLISGQKAVVEPKEMIALTKKNYENLPEVKNKKEEQKKLQDRSNFLKERQDKVKQLDQKIKSKYRK